MTSPAFRDRPCIPLQQKRNYVADAALAYAKLRAGYFQAVYNYNLGFAKLDHAAGRDVAVVQPLAGAVPT